MVFASPIFLGYFLPLVLGGYYLLPATGPARNRWLLGASYVFYGWWDPRLVPALFAGCSLGKLGLQPGMTLKANIVLERQSFLAWLLQPLNAVLKRTA